MTSKKELQLIVVAVECSGLPRSSNKKIRIYQRDVLRFELSSSLKDSSSQSSFYKEFTECAVRGVILEKIEAGKENDRAEDEDINDGKKTIHRAKVEIYDPHSCKFVIITERGSNSIVDRFGKRMRCIVSDIIWSSSSVEKEETQSTNSLGAVEEIKTPLLAIMGRYFPYDPENGMDFTGKKLYVKEIPNSQVDGTGLNVWDGAILLAKYLEIFPEKVRSKSVLELGSGCGLVGIAAGLLGAKEVILTDLEYSLPLMRDNVKLNINQVRDSNCETMMCKMCDWFNPPSLDSFEFSLSKRAESSAEGAPSLVLFPDVILVADCVWLEELVDPLLRTLDVLTGLGTTVIVSYQRRGKATHNKFWSGLHNMFGTVLNVDVNDTSPHGLEKPNTLFLLECQKCDNNRS